MTISARKLGAAALLACCLLPNVQAEVLTWRLSPDGTNGLSGSFDFDTQSRTFSNIAIDANWYFGATSSGFINPSPYFFEEEPAGPGPYPDAHFLYLGFYPDDPSSGGFVTVGEMQTNYAVGYYWWNHEIYAEAIPEPETHALMLAGLGLVGLARRRRGVRTPVR